jgi:hypothetical protein
MKNVLNVLQKIFKFIEMLLGITDLVYKGTSLSENVEAKTITATISFESISVIENYFIDFIAKFLTNIEKVVQCQVSGNSLIVTIQY